MTRERRGVIAFRNADQRVLWDCELTGQISDGQWENSLPQDHWEAWCAAATIVDPSNVGYEGFYPRRDSYGFTRKTFLGVLADFTPDPHGFYLAGRAMEYVRVSRLIGAEDTDLVEAVRDGIGYASLSSITNDKVLRTIVRFGLDPLRAAADDVAAYAITDLMADLRDIQSIIKVRRLAAA